MLDTKLSFGWVDRPKTGRGWTALEARGMGMVRTRAAGGRKGAKSRFETALLGMGKVTQALIQSVNEQGENRD